MKKIIAISCILFLAGCSAAVQPKYWEWGEKVCSANGGIDYMTAYTIFFPNVTCKNGAKFIGGNQSINQK